MIGLVRIRRNFRTFGHEDVAGFVDISVLKIDESVGGFRNISFIISV